LLSIGIRSVGDLLYYFPRGYFDRSQIVRIADLRSRADKGEAVTVFAEVYRQEARRTRRSNKLIFFLTVRDESGFLTCVWFEGFHWLKDAFEPGELLALSTIPSLDKLGRPQFVHPQFDRLKSTEEDEPDWGKLFNTGGIIPKYRSGADLEKVGLDSRGFRRIIRSAIDRSLSDVRELLPQDILRKNALRDLSSALRSIHFPQSLEDLELARRRLKFDELFFLQLMQAIRRRNIEQEQKSAIYRVESPLSARLRESLHFSLTGAQQRVLEEINADLDRPHPMNRLLQGDVGSGKTIVALLAALRAVDSGLQVAFMAPTEILAEQHFRSLQEFLRNIPVTVRLLLGGQRKKLREDILESIRAGSADIVVGTHALLEEGVVFSKLGFVVVDEQHRFGVVQRAALRKKGANPDVLVMTATPIPRTLAMTLYGDLDISVIDEMPANRRPIRTALRAESQKDRIYEFVREEIKRGRQAYIVFPLIEESEKLDLKAAVQEYEHLSGKIFPDLRLGLLHGRMKSEEKEDVMKKFISGATQMLVATTVIEVGIDVPNATVMVINDAERFGLSQLHQLRGRVGRGADQSYCILIADYGWYAAHARGMDAGEVRTEQECARTRLETMVETSDGFRIAEVDLKLRGPGEVFGTRQSGIPELRIANLSEDGDLIALARREASDVIANDPQLRHPSNEGIRIQFEKKFRAELDLGKIG
jgi:ATP-dependent DNA helicase RecG